MPIVYDDCMIRRILGVDPSIKSLGWGFIKLSKAWKMQPLVYIASGVVNQRTSMQVMDRIDESVRRINTFLLKYSPTDVVIEEPEIFGSGKGVAALNSGAVNKLIAQAFSIRQHIISVYPQITVHMAKVRSWKGQTPKSVSQDRVFRTFGLRFEDHNEADGVALARWYGKQLIAGKIE